MEVAEFLGRYAEFKTGAGRQRVVRHGHLPEREIMTGIGPVAVRQPRVRDREATAGERIRFSSTILPPYARRTKSLEVLIPILYLKGVSTGDFEEALGVLLGKDGGGLSASTIEAANFLASLANVSSILEVDSAGLPVPRVGRPRFAKAAAILGGRGSSGLSAII